MNALELDGALDGLRTELRRSEFDRRVSAAMDALHGDDLFKDWTQPLREAWIANRFGAIVRASHLQLAPKAAPKIDFWVTRNEIRTGFDATVAMDANRKPAEEAWLRRTSERSYSEETDAEMTYQEELAVDRIRRRLRDKARIADGRRVIVYVNTGWLPEDDEFHEGVVDLHHAYRSMFAEAYLLVRNGLLQIAPVLAEHGEWRSE